MRNVLSLVLSEEDRRRIRELRDLFEDLAETLSLLVSEEAVEELLEAEMDVEDGRVRPFDEFLRELEER